VKTPVSETCGYEQADPSQAGNSPRSNAGVGYCADVIFFKWRGPVSRLSLQSWLAQFSSSPGLGALETHARAASKAESVFVPQPVGEGMRMARSAEVANYFTQ
jgi:hypothetical protein